MTTTVSGQPTTSTQFGVRVAQAAGTAGGSSGAAAPAKTGSAGVAIGAAVMGIAALGF